MRTLCEVRNFASQKFRLTPDPRSPLVCIYFAVVYGYRNFAIGLDPKFFHKLHIESISENLKLWTPISNQIQTPHSVAHEPKYLVVSLFPHGAKVLAILSFVRQNWLKWSCDKYDTHKKTWVKVKVWS